MRRPTKAGLSRPSDTPNRSRCLRAYATVNIRAFSRRSSACCGTDPGADAPAAVMKPSCALRRSSSMRPKPSACLCPMRPKAGRLAQSLCAVNTMALPAAIILTHGFFWFHFALYPPTATPSMLDPKTSSPASGSTSAIFPRARRRLRTSSEKSVLYEPFCPMMSTFESHR